MGLEEAAAILERTRALYSNLQSYADEGSVTCNFESANRRPQQSRIQFSTRFRRDGAFFFEYHEERVELASRRRTAIWGRPGSYKRWFHTRPDEIREWPDPSRHIAAATGVSRGSAALVPALLGLLRHARLPKAEAIERVERTQQADSECDELWFKSIEGDPTRLRVDAQSSLLLAKHSRASFTEERLLQVRERRARVLAHRKNAPPLLPRRLPGPFESITLLELEPRIDIELADSEFEFEPPS